MHAKKVEGYWVFTGKLFSKNFTGDRIHSNSLTTTMRPDLHTGHKHGLIPVNRKKRFSLVSGSCCCLTIASMTGFSASVNCWAILRLTVLLHIPNLHIITKRRGKMCMPKSRRNSTPSRVTSFLIARVTLFLIFYRTSVINK